MHQPGLNICLISSECVLFSCFYVTLVEKICSSTCFLPQGIANYYQERNITDRIPKYGGWNTIRVLETITDSLKRETTSKQQ